MLVRELMVPKPPVMTPDTTLPEALSLMKEKGVRRFPVVNASGHLVGIVSQTDLHNAAPSQATLLSFWEIPTLLGKITVNMVMVKDVATTTADAPVEDAAKIMADRHISCLPVMDGRTVVGLINQSDLFRAFMEQLGARRKGVRIWARTSDQKGTVAKIASAITSVSGDIVGLGFQEVTDVKGSRWEITVKVGDVPKDKLVAALKPYLVEILDVRES